MYVRMPILNPTSKRRPTSSAISLPMYSYHTLSVQYTLHFCQESQGIESDETDCVGKQLERANEVITNNVLVGFQFEGNRLLLFIAVELHEFTEIQYRSFPR